MDTGRARDAQKVLLSFFLGLGVGGVRMVGLCKTAQIVFFLYFPWVRINRSVKDEIDQL